MWKVKGARCCRFSRLNFSRACIIITVLVLISCFVQFDWYGKQKTNHRHNQTSRAIYSSSPPLLRSFIRPEIHTALLEPQPCSQDTDLIIVVCSSVPNEEARRAIRDTWGKEATSRKGVRFAFLLGKQNSSEWQDKIEAESRNYSDIIQEDFVDSYENLTLKTTMLLKWVNQTCPNARFVLKSDDDMLVNVDNLLAFLKEPSRESHLLVGNLFSGAVPIRNPMSKWFTPSWFDDDTFPNFLSGTAYVISGNIVRDLYNVALHTPFFRLEDVFLTGLCAKRLGLTPTHNSCFHFDDIELEPCRVRRIITAHRISPQKLYSTWEAMKNPNVRCGNSITTFFLNAIKRWYC